MIKAFNIAKIPDFRGNLSFIEPGQGLDFPIRRVYWTYDVPAGAERFGRALRHTAEVIIALSGSFDVITDNGLGERKTLRLERPWQAVKIPPMTWRSLENFTSGSVALTIASEVYDPDEYIRHTPTFIREAAMASDMEITTGSEITHPRTIGNAHAKSHVDQCRIVNLDVHRHPGGGALSSVNNGCGEIPFDVNRVYYLYDVPADTERGGHSHISDYKLMIAVAGSFDVITDDGHRKRRFNLNRPYKALAIPPGIWRTMDNFSSGSVCLVLTSHLFDEADYIRSYPRFKKITSCKTYD